MKPKVIVYKKVDSTVLDYVRNACEVIYFENLDSQTLPYFFQELKEAEGILGSGLRIDEKFLKQAPKLKVISNISVGYDNLDLPQITMRKIMATNTPGVLYDSVADTIFGLLLATARRMPELNQMVKSGKWTENISEEQFGVDVHHKKLGIIGMGGVGAAIAKRAHFGFDMSILYHNRSRNLKAEQTYQATYCSLEEICQQADFICLMTPLTPNTVKLIGEKEFKLMKKSAIFVNGSRGATVDEDALVWALQNREILAAGLDVYTQEPISPDHPLLTMDNVVTLPHIGSATYETRLKMAQLAAENLVLGLQGKQPPSIINQEVLTDVR
jgi:gluconate 2-dehydrogenase